MRDLKPRQVRKIVGCIASVGILALLAGMVFSVTAAMAVGCLILVAGLGFQLVFYHCPHCGKYLDRSGGDFCPYCGKNVNE